LIAKDGKVVAKEGNCLWKQGNDMIKVSMFQVKRGNSLKNRESMNGFLTSK
jgi:hypothetical protein